jgi:hypothetical protein
MEIDLPFVAADAYTLRINERNIKTIKKIN